MVLISNNIFAHIFKAREAEFGVNGENELKLFKRQIKAELASKVCELPRFLMFKVTNRCNSSCLYCGYSNRNKQNNPIGYERDDDKISLDKIKQIIDEAKELGVLGIAYNGGEPLMHPDIVDIISYTHQNNISPILMTNGLLLPHMWEQLGSAGLKYLMISLDSLEKTNFEKQRGVSLSKTLSGINAALKMREKYKDIIIHLTVVVTKYNYKDIEELVHYSQRNNIWLELFVYHHMGDDEDNLSVEDEESFRSVLDKIKGYKRDGLPISTSMEYLDHMLDFAINKQRKPDNYACLVGYTMLQIDGYLNVRPCWDSRFGVMGNLNKDTIREIWTGKQMEEYRMEMQKGKCFGCWNMCNEVNSLLFEV